MVQADHGGLVGKGLEGMMEMLCIWNVMVTTQLYAFLKTDLELEMGALTFKLWYKICII